MQLNQQETDNLLALIPGKGPIDPNTTTLQFKRDFIDFFGPMNLETCVEVSSCYGNTTFVLSHIFNQVGYVEYSNPEHFNSISTGARTNVLKNRTNIMYFALDSYNQPWPFRYVDVIFIDCAHNYPACRSDINNAKKCLKEGGYLVFDDWDLPEADYGVKRAIQDDPDIEIIKFIGEKITFNPQNYFDFKIGVGEYEGVICRLKKKE